MIGLDQRLLMRFLYFQAADVEVHRVSADPLLHYELAPGTSCDCRIGDARYRVTIDEHGARYPTHPLAKGPDVFRIMCVGGSTVYGSIVNDDQTIPAALERRLNANGSARRYEAWNFGTPAYMLRQAARVAETRLDTVRPDLVLVLLHNAGRRAFLMPPTYNAFDYPWKDILADPDLFREQFLFPWWLPSLEHSQLLHDSALARAALALLPGFDANQRCEWCMQRDQEAARALSDAASARGIPVVFYSIPANRTVPTGDPNPRAPGPDSVYPELTADRYIDLYQPGREPDFYLVHPPPATLDEFARLLSETLRARGFIPAA